MKKSPHIATAHSLDRRHFLRGTGGIFLGLPMLEAMIPAFQTRARAAQSEPPKRFVAACAGLGFHTPYLFPEKEGLDYQPSPYLEKLKAHRQKMTVFSGLSHPEQNGNNGHASGLTWLTSAKRPGLAGFKNSVSLDQLIAQQIGVLTRFPYLALSAGGESLSWTANGVEIPGENSPARLFKAMFIEGSADEVKKQVRRFQTGQSILDTVVAEAGNLSRDLVKADQEKLDEYLTAVRDLEKRLQQSENWAQKPKPKIEAAEPKDIQDRNDAIAKQKLMYEMIVLALQTDSTRNITFALGGMNAVPSNLPGVKTDWHNLSHHGRDETKISELKIIEEAEFDALNGFLDKLASIKEGDKTLLDQTAILFGSNLGNASSHDWRNLPIIVAGGGFQHSGYTRHDEKDNTPLANLFVQLGQRMGLEIDQFGSSTAVGVRGLG